MKTKIMVKCIRCGLHKLVDEEHVDQPFCAMCSIPMIPEGVRFNEKHDPAEGE